MNEPYRLRYTNQLVGGFLLVLFTSTIALGIAVTRVSRILVKPDRYFVNVNEDESTALQVGTEVVQLGKRIGQVEALEYADTDGLIKITLAIDPDYSKQITTGTELSLERKFGLGAAFIKVRRTAAHNQAAAPLAPGSALLNFQGEVDRVKRMSDDFDEVTESVQKVQQDLSPALNNIDLAANQVKGSFRNSVEPAFDQANRAFVSVERTSESFQLNATETLAELRSTTMNLNAQLSELIQKAEASADAATSASDSVAKTTSNINLKTDKLKDEISETLKVIRDSLASIDSLTNETRDLVHVLQGEAEDLPGTTEQVRNSVEDTDRLVKEIRSHWLLRGVRQSVGATEQISPSSVRTQAAPR